MTNSRNSGSLSRTSALHFPSLAALSLLVLLRPAADAPAREPDPAEDEALEQAVDGAIDGGVEFLLDRIARPAGWSPEFHYPSGYAALQILALLKSDVSYLHPIVRRGLEFLESRPHEKVYSASLVVMACDAVLEQMDRDARADGPLAFLATRDRPPPSRSGVLRMMKDATAWLIRARIREHGVWSYEPPPAAAPPEKAYYDHSNSQFAILALGMAARRGIQVPRSLWEEIADHFVRHQEPEGEPVTGQPAFRPPGKGKKVTRRAPPEESLYRDPAVTVTARGWGYRVEKDGARPTFSMTSAGQSSLLLAYIHLTSSSRGFRPSRVEKLERAIRDGYGWLTRHLNSSPTLRSDPYALYSLEKVGDIGAVETLGECRWFRAGARALLRTQGEEGAWGPPRTARARSDTSLALLYLGRATSLGESRNPLIRLTGESRPDRDRSTARYRVFLPSLGGTVPIIRFFRQLRYRPNRQLLELSEELLDAYDADYLNELVLYGLTLRRSPSERIRTRGREMVRRITGLDLGGLEGHAEYLEWAEEWAEVVRIGRRRLEGGVGRLRERLLACRSLPLVKKMIWALQRINGRPAIAELLVLMESPDLSLRRVAHDAARFLSGRDFAFHADADEKTRAAELKTWREWWREARKSPSENGF